MASSLAARADLPKAADLIAKGLARYDNARTYQGTIEVQSLSPSTDTTMTIAARIENDTKGKIRRAAYTTTTKEVASGKQTTTTEITIDDGKTEVSVHPAEKEFTRSPSSPGRASDLLRSAIEKCTSLAGDLTVSIGAAHGRATYVLSTETPDGRVEIVMDRDTLHFLSIHAMHRDGASKTVADVALSHQVFDEPIAASVFKWRAPAGYSEVKAE